MRPRDPRRIAAGPGAQAREGRLTQHDVLTHGAARARGAPRVLAAPRLGLGQTPSTLTEGLSVLSGLPAPRGQRKKAREGACHTGEGGRAGEGRRDRAEGGTRPWLTAQDGAADQGPPARPPQTPAGPPPTSPRPLHPAMSTGEGLSPGRRCRRPSPASPPQPSVGVLGLCDKVPQTGGLNTTETYRPHFRRPGPVPSGDSAAGPSGSWPGASSGGW